MKSRHFLIFSIVADDDRPWADYNPTPPAWINLWYLGKFQTIRLPRTLISVVNIGETLGALPSPPLVFLDQSPNLFHEEKQVERSIAGAHSTEGRNPCFW